MTTAILERVQDTIENNEPSVADQSRANRILSRSIESISPKPLLDLETVAVYRLPPDEERDGLRILSAEEERAMFRAMNDAKYRAIQLRHGLSEIQPSVDLMDEIEHLLNLADQIRNRIVHIFMKLGASIARRLSNTEFSADELGSEANMTLMRAVDCFDCELGFRFSTYATNAVRRNLIRHIKNYRKRKEVITGSDCPDEICESRKWTWHYEQQVSRATATLKMMMRRLEERDQYILRNRFGLAGDCRGQSLQRIADDLGVSRERVRQLENRAAERLRQMAKEEDFELLGA